MRVGQVINNLLSNAIKYTDHGSVDVKASFTRLPNNQLELYCKVIDTGIGIPHERIDQLFQKFMQVDASNTRRYGGTGLGLSIARQLVELMGGVIGVESQEGLGSTFWFKIPFEVSDKLVQDEGVSRNSFGQAPASAIHASKAKLLVAED